MPYGFQAMRCTVELHACESTDPTKRSRREATAERSCVVPQTPRQASVIGFAFELS